MGSFSERKATSNQHLLSFLYFILVIHKMISSSRIAACSKSLIISRGNVARRASRSVSSTAAYSNPSGQRIDDRSIVGYSLLAVAAATLVSYDNTTKTQLSAGGAIPSSGDIISTGTPVKEPATGILFPQLCNGYYLVGTGVRYKYGFVKVYAVGTYLDPLAMSAVSKSQNGNVIEQALMDPTYPRTIRIVMNRALSIEKYTTAIVESLKPRMMGQDLEKLEEFKKLNPPVDLVEGTR
jgi:hypothetical protein